MYTPLPKSGCEYNFVYFDVETTSGERHCDITQLSAVWGKEVFNKYVMPEQKISSKVSELTHIFVRDNKMFYLGQEVEAVSIDQCVSQFIKWCDEVVGGKVVLIAHNCKTFDAKKIVFHVSKCNKIDRFEQFVSGFADTLPMFRKMYKGSKELKNFKQTTLVQYLLKATYNAHNACDDSKSLQDLVENSKADKKDILAHSFSVSAVVQAKVRDEELLKNENTLEPLRNVCSTLTLNKIASSGLEYKHIKLAYNRNGLDGIKYLFSDKDPNGRIRVTNSKKIINMVQEFMSKIQ